MRRTRPYRALTGVPLIGLLAGVLLAALLTVAAAPAQAAASYPVTVTGESYGPGVTQKVSLYRPSASGRRPVVYFIHGGSWISGSRNQWDADATRWASRGWVAVNLDYTRGAENDGRTGDGAQMLADVATVVKHYEKQSYADPYRQILVGDSAGAHLATTIGAGMKEHVRGVIAWSPVASPANAAEDGAVPGAPADVALLGARAREFFGYSANTSALPYLQKYGGTSMWIAGSQDEWLDWNRQGGQLCAALGSRCSSHLVPGTLHGRYLRDAHPELQEDSYRWAMTAITTFVRTADRQAVTPPTGQYPPRTSPAGPGSAILVATRLELLQAT